MEKKGLSTALLWKKIIQTNQPTKTLFSEIFLKHFLNQDFLHPEDVLILTDFNINFLDENNKLLTTKI